MGETQGRHKYCGTGQNSKIYLAIPNFTAQVPSKFMVNTFQIVDYTNSIGYDVDINMIERMRVERARNDFVIDALDKGADYLFFLDDDVLPEINVIEKLIDADKDIACAPIKARNEEEALILLDKDFKWLYKLKEPKEIIACHMGATLIKRKVLENVKEHHMRPFEFGNTEIDGRIIYLSEDTTFCLRADNLGFKTWAIPISTRHLGEQIENVFTS